MNLLEKAKNAHRQNRYTKPSVEECQLVMAFLKNEITPTQVAIALTLGNRTSTGAIYWGWRTIQNAVAHGFIKIELVSDKGGE